MLSHHDLNFQCATSAAFPGDQFLNRLIKEAADDPKYYRIRQHHSAISSYLGSTGEHPVVRSEPSSGLSLENPTWLDGLLELLTFVDL